MKYLSMILGIALSLLLLWSIKDKGGYFYPDRLTSCNPSELLLPYDDNPEKTSHHSLSVNRDLLEKAFNFCQLSQNLRVRGDVENAIHKLDQAYALILKANTDETPELWQQKEDLRLMISRRILEIYASRTNSVSGKYKAIPMVMNKHIQAEIDFYTTGNGKEDFLEAYKRSGRYRPRIVAALKKAGLPTELSWLPLIESGFTNDAVSNARAVGMWQFISSTGYKFGLKRTKYIDERMDPEKSTQAAIAYLKALHRIFGDWTTVLAAYNCGEGKVLSVIREQNVKYLDDFWDLYERLPRQTARYVPRFIATLHMVSHPEKYGLETLPLLEPFSYEEILISEQIDLKQIAEFINVPEELLKSLNPELRREIVPGEQYALKVPQDKGELLLSKLEASEKSDESDSDLLEPSYSFTYHKVRKGETLSAIAKQYRISVQSIALANDIYKQHYIVRGEMLKIPQENIFTN